MISDPIQKPSIILFVSAMKRNVNRMSLAAPGLLINATGKAGNGVIAGTGAGYAQDIYTVLDNLRQAIPKVFSNNESLKSGLINKDFEA